MDDYIEIRWAVGSLDEARRVSRFLVQENLVACAQIIPWIESIYLWDSQLETGQESKVLLKTRKEHFEKVKEVIVQNSSYEVPEVTAVPIVAANQEYVDWMQTNTTIKEEV